MLNARTIQAHHADACSYLWGDLDMVATDCRAPEDAGPDSLVFVTDAAQLAAVRQRRAAILVVQRDVAGEVAADETAFGCCFSVSSVPMVTIILPPRR